MNQRNASRTRLTLVMSALACMAISAWTDSPHFVGKVTSKLVGDDAQVCFKEAGLGTNQQINYIASADGTATYVCVNSGGQCPNAANKVTVSGPVTTPATFSSGKNGSISQCLTLNAPGPGSFSCPAGQTLTLADVTFTNIKIRDDSFGIEKTATPSTLAATLFVCP